MSQSNSTATGATAMAADVTCPHYNLQPPACSLTYGEVYPLMFRVTQGLVLGMVLLLLGLSLYRARMVLKARDNHTKAAPTIVLYILLLDFCLIPPAVSPCGLSSMVPWQVIAICSGLSRCGLIAIYFTMLCHWTVITCKISTTKTLSRYIKFVVQYDTAMQVSSVALQWIFTGWELRSGTMLFHLHSLFMLPWYVLFCTTLSVNAIIINQTFREYEENSTQNARAAAAQRDASNIRLFRSRSNSSIGSSTRVPEGTLSSAHQRQAVQCSVNSMPRNNAGSVIQYSVSVSGLSVQAGDDNGNGRQLLRQNSRQQQPQQQPPAQLLPALGSARMHALWRMRNFIVVCAAVGFGICTAIVAVWCVRLERNFEQEHGWLAIMDCLARNFVIVLCASFALAMSAQPVSGNLVVAYAGSLCINGVTTNNNYAGNDIEPSVLRSAAPVPILLPGRPLDPPMPMHEDVEDSSSGDGGHEHSQSQEIHRRASVAVVAGEKSRGEKSRFFPRERDEEDGLDALDAEKSVVSRVGHISKSEKAGGRYPPAETSRSSLWSNVRTRQRFYKRRDSGCSITQSNLRTTAHSRVQREAQDLDTEVLEMEMEDNRLCPSVEAGEALRLPPVPDVDVSVNSLLRTEMADDIEEGGGEQITYEPLLVSLEGEKPPELVNPGAGAEPTMGLVGCHSGGDLEGILDALKSRTDAGDAGDAGDADV